MSDIIIITPPQPLISSTDTAPPAVTANSINTSVHPFESRTRTASTPRETIEMTSTKASAVHSTQVRQHTLHSPPLSHLGRVLKMDGIPDGHGIFLPSVTPWITHRLYPIDLRVYAPSFARRVHQTSGVCELWICARTCTLCDVW